MIPRDITEATLRIRLAGLKIGDREVVFTEDESGWVIGQPVYEDGSGVSPAKPQEHTFTAVPSDDGVQEPKWAFLGVGICLGIVLCILLRKGIGA